MESKPKKRKFRPEGKKGQVIFYNDQEKEALAHIGDGSVAEGTRIAVRWAAHFWNVGLRPDHNLNHVGLSLFVDDELADDL
jgi:hypothetical protein